ncbi:MAG: hypothetical protein Q4D61_08910 [Cardiobacteriaceae bacterium]|nr:hypothetical protein [Cardiobacteriaceae bacterium]
MRLRLALLCLAAFELSHAESVITLDPAHAPAHSDGEVSGFAFRTYRFTAREGQYYRVELDNPDVGFSLLPVRRGDKIPDGAEGYIPASGDYELRILQNRDAAQSGQSSRYRLTLTVNDQQSDTADAASRSRHIRFQGSLRTSESGRLQGTAEDSYRFHANAGQQLTLDLDGKDILASLHYLGREQPTLDPRAQILPLGGPYELRLALNRAAQRRHKPHDYRFTLTLAAGDGANPETPAAPVAAVPPAPPVQAVTTSNDRFILDYQCALDTTLRIHYGELASTEPRASVQLADSTFHLAQSARHSTPAQAVFYGKKHYLVLTTAQPSRQSRILRFEKRDGDDISVLAADCQPR